MPADAALTRVRVTTRVLELSQRAAGGDLQAQADLEALGALLEQPGRRDA